MTDLPFMTANEICVAADRRASTYARHDVDDVDLAQADADFVATVARIVAERTRVVAGRVDAAEARLARVEAVLERNVRESGGMFNAVTAKQLRAALDAPQGTEERLADQGEGSGPTEWSAGLRSETQ